MNKRRALLLMTLMVLTLLAACAEGEAPPVDTPSPTTVPIVTTVPTPLPTPEPTPEPVRNPLSGLPIENPDRVARRPVLVMINNLRKALPQLGIGSADILYEIVAEGGITRIVAVFQDSSGVGEIGSVRSTRSYYLDLAQGHDGMLLHAGASEMAYAEIPKRGALTLDAIRGGYEGTLYYRDQARRKSAGLEHSMFTSGERIEAAIEKAKFRTEHEEGYDYPIRFSEGAVTSGRLAETISVRFSSIKTGTFDYDTALKMYMVGQYGGPHLDGETQISVKNVLVLRTAIWQIPGDAYGRMDAKLVGTGTGFYAVNGMANEITWSKASQNNPFVYTYPDGTAVTFEPGTFYICIISENATLEME